MNILSIDWDYFVNCNASDRFVLFPDGGNEDINAALIDYIWNTRYVYSKTIDKDIEQIPIKECYDELFDIMRNIKWNKKIMIVNSHKHCYDFIKENLAKNEKVNLYNVDFHHDCYALTEDVNCGNWIPHLLKEDKINKIVWIKQEDSDIYEGDLPIEEHLDFDCLREIKWDGIFICKSPLWSPPHLDEMFIDIFEFIKANLPVDCLYEPYALEDRWNNKKDEN